MQLRASGSGIGATASAGIASAAEGRLRPASGAGNVSPAHRAPRLPPLGG